MSTIVDRKHCIMEDHGSDQRRLPSPCGKRRIFASQDSVSEPPRKSPAAFENKQLTIFDFSHEHLELGDKTPYRAPRWRSLSPRRRHRGSVAEGRSIAAAALLLGQQQQQQLWPDMRLVPSGQTDMNVEPSEHHELCSQLDNEHQMCLDPAEQDDCQSLWFQSTQPLHLSPPHSACSSEALSSKMGISHNYPDVRPRSSSCKTIVLPCQPPCPRAPIHKATDVPLQQEYATWPLLWRSLSADGYDWYEQRQRRHDTAALLFASTPDLGADDDYARLLRRRGAVCYANVQAPLLMFQHLSVDDK